MQIALDQIKLGKNHSRPYGPGDVSDLMDSLREHGQLQPVVVDNENNLLMGFRRYEAAKRLGWVEIRAERRDTAKESVEKKAIKNLVENLVRKDLSLWEEIQAIRDTFGENPSLKHISMQLSKSRDWVRPRVRVWSLPQDYIDKIRLGQIDIGQLRGRLNLRHSDKITTAHHSPHPKQHEIEDVVTKLMAAGRIAEAKALSFAIGAITRDRLLPDESEGT